MNEPTQNETEPSAPPLGDWLWMVRGLLISAMFVTAYLALIGLGRVGRAPGCGPGSGCEQVLSSPWAWWLGVPVALLGLGLYAAFFLSTFLLKPDDTEKARRALNAISLCSFAVLGAAVWFVGVQAVGIGAFCAYCCVAHGLASLAAVLFLSKANGVGVRLSVRLNLAGGMGTAIGVMALIAGVQVFVPHKPPAPKVVELSGGGLQLNTDRLPLLGPADAQHQIECLFDYTCHHCRQQHGIILETIDGFDGKLACWMVPMPLDTSCNGVIERTEPQHVGACEYAKICLAVHQVAPAKYEAFDRWLFKNPKKQKTLDAVRQYAAGLVGTGFLEKALTSAAVRDQLQENISTYETISKIAGSRMMPQTIISDHVVIGPSQSVAEFEALVREHLNLNEPKPVVKPVPGPEVALDQIVESPDGLIRAKGEEVPFTGHVISRFPDGSLQFKRPVVDGLKHGLAVRWHANGRKAEELPWKEGMRDGLARAWSGTGEKLGEKMFRPKPRERESFEQRLAEAGRVYRKRKKLDETVWKEEAQAQVYEETFVALWDALRAAEDKWKPFEEFVLESIALVKKGKTTEHDWSIRATHYVGGGMKLDLAGWREWLRALRARGIEVVETEWHQEEFDSKDGAPRSVFRFVVHATGPGLMRYIVRGRLGVAWTDRKDARGHFQAGHVEVTEAVVLTRSGKAPFRELARLSPGEGEPKGYPGPEGSAPMSMPLLVYDLDRDGRSEIVLAGANLVYWNQGKGKFKKGTLCKHYRARLQAAVLADFDNDGIADLLGMPEESPPVLYRGGAGGRFEQPPERIEVGLLHASTCVTAGDIDGDGDLDAWLTQNKPAYVGGQMPTPYYDANDGYPSYLIKNDGKGKFTDATKEAGLAGKQWRRTYSSSLVDLDADGDLDLVVVNDFAGLDIHLNDGTGRFTDVTGQLGDDRFGFGMSHALADFNGDGRLDLYMVGMDSTTARRLDRMKLGRAEFPGHQEARMRMAYGNRLFLGGEDFLKQAPYSDLLARTGWAWGCTALDFDNDGDRDLYITNGFISGDSCKDHCTTFWTKDIYTGTSKENPALDGFFKLTFLRLKNISWNGFEHNVLLMNEPGESFLNVAFLMNAAQEFDARALVSDDVDGDGRVDLVMIEKVFERGRDKADHLRVLLNAWERPGHWIGVRLHEHGRGFSPVGARITVLAGGRRQVLPVVTGDSHLSQHANQKHFGLGAVDRVDAIEVRWPNGTVSHLENPAVDQYHEVKPE